ncbi:MAG: hypothetical protein HYY64_14415 [Candidatus Rokubacteria bacterium]|nr:hypothetical protein [Candidatus Rokubacteria bacterium]
MALPLALFALVMLSGLLLAFLTMAGMEPTIAANLADTARARYVADAGVEWAYDQLASNPTTWSAILAANGGTMATNMTLPGLTATNGTFTVTVRNDNQANDNQMTGQPVDTGNDVTDTNNVVILTATGNLPNGSSRQIQVVVSRVPFPLPPGTVSLTGQTQVSLPGNMEINGNDTLAGSTTAGDGACAPRYAMTIPNGGNEAAFEAGLNPSELQTGKNAKIKGKAQDPSKPGEGVNAIAPEEPSDLTSQQVTDFVNAVKGRADIVLNSTAADPLVFSNNQAGGIATKGQNGTIGPSCATDWNSKTCWGIPADPTTNTPAKPKIVYVSAQTPNPTMPFNPASLEVRDIKGAGILIVENGTFFLNGAPGWQGLIIVTGKDIGFQICCGQIHEVWGSIVINETNAAEVPLNVDFTGGQHSDLYYSCQAINNALNVRAAIRLTSWRER